MGQKKFKSFYLLALMLLIAFACTNQSQPFSTLPKSVYPLKTLDPSDYEIRTRLREESVKRKQEALLRASTLKEASPQRKYPRYQSTDDNAFSIQRYRLNESVSYSSHLLYYNNVFLSDPFTINATEKATASDSSEFWYTTAFYWTKINQKDNYQIGYVDYMDYLYTYSPPRDFVFARPDGSYWESWDETNYLDKWFKISSKAEMYISSSPDAKGPPDVIGELRYKIYSSSSPRVIKYEGIIENLKPPIDLVKKHSMTAGSYYLELFIAKPTSLGSNSLGLKKPLFHTVIEPLPRADYYIDIDLKSSRWITPLNNQDTCANGLSVQVNRKAGIETEQPLFAESVVWVYKYPSFDFVGEFPALAGTGAYTFIWDGKDPNGNPLPDGMYNIEVALKNYRKASSVKDRGDWEIVHISNNTPVDPRLCFFDENPGGSTPPEESQGFCSETTDPTTGSTEKSCFSCPDGQDIVFKNGQPVSCQPVVDNENEKSLFRTLSNGTQAYNTSINNICAKSQPSPSPN